MSNTPSRRRVGLALGGGAARGLAHVGVLLALTEARIPIDCVAGTSMGAMVGAAYCAGLDVDELLAVANETGWRHISGLTRPTQGLLSFAKMEDWVTARVGDVDVRDLAIPFAAMATDLETGEKVTLREGPVGRVVRASCSVPGVAAPVLIDGRLLCDGGVSDNLPDDAARGLGADYVIGVDVFAPAYRTFLGPIGVTMAAIEMLVENAGGGNKNADCMIVPDLIGKSYLRLSKHRELIEAGAQATREMLPEIRAALDLPVQSV